MTEPIARALAFVSMIALIIMVLETSPHRRPNKPKEFWIAAFLFIVVYSISAIYLVLEKNS